jgi:MoaA/NifB/PqqE/SkfB family radical SAM enzyme
MPRLIDESFRLRRLARRVGWRPRSLRAQAPERPVGAKLELTHACNLRCGFCYTDSPRHTLSRTPDLPDEAWLAIADEVVRLGVIEVVLTGGEPLLRRELVLRLVDQLGRPGIGLTLNTNGWFLDDATADGLAAARGLQAHISIDGAAAATHDAQRGVPGSWGRAVRAASRLLDRGVRVQIVHVVTPGNQAEFPAFLELMWTLGVDSVQVTPVVEIGAAARGGRWAVSRSRLRRTISRFQAVRGDDMRVVLQPGNAGVLAVNDEAAPAALLVRPSGVVLTDSLHPFVFGHALEDGLEECWRRIASDWRNPRISRWAGSLRSHRDLPSSEVVPYLDDEMPVRGPVAELDARRHADEPVPAPAPPRNGTGDAGENVARARAEVRELAMDRRYRLGAARLGGGGDSHYVRASSGGKVTRLNGTAALLARALDGGTARDAVDQLASRFTGGVDRARLEEDMLAARRALARREILVPAGRPHEDSR